MKTWVRRSLNVGVLSAGFLLIGGAAAQAADMTTGNNAGVGNGNQLGSVLQLPVDISGNAVGVAGFADASSEGGAWATNGGGSSESMTSGFNSGVLSGNQLSNVVQVPVSACGNAIAVLGFADASCTGGAGASNGGGGNGGGGNGGGGNGSGSGSGSGGYDEAASAFAEGSGMTTGYNAGIGSGNQVSNVIQAPIDLCGNAISLAGFASAECDGGATATNGGAEEMTTGFNAGILSGNQVSNVVQVPISVCGNSIALLGFADASCTGGAGANNGGDDDVDSPPADDDDDDNGSGSGNDDDPDYGGGMGSGGYAASGSVNSTANAAKKSNATKKSNAAKKAKATKVNGENSRALGATGRSAAAKASGSGGAMSTGGSDMVTGYNAGILSGNQVSSVVQIPVDISGNALAILGFASASSTGGAWAHNA